jgi:hypothetical protein
MDDGADARTPAPRDDHRASDADRQRVADRLRHALDEGRLTLLEYDERLGSAYGAKTYGELAEVTRDLPAPGAATLPAAPPTEAEPATPRGRTRQHLLQQGGQWLGGAVITNGIWAATTGADLHHYWPGAVMLVWGAGIVGRLFKGEHRRDEPDQNRPPHDSEPHRDRHGHLARVQRREEQLRIRQQHRTGRRDLRRAGPDPRPAEQPDQP